MQYLLSLCKWGSFDAAGITALTAAAGMIIFNTTTNKHQGYDGSSWNDYINTMIYELLNPILTILQDTLTTPPTGPAVGTWMWIAIGLATTVATIAQHFIINK